MAPSGGDGYNQYMASSDGVMVTLRLFAIYRERVGQEAIEATLKAGATVEDALRHLGELHPNTLILMPTTMVAVNLEYAERDYVLQSNDEIALIPPVSGGQGSSCT
jgi:molybdopterin converting factor subunit 1